MSGLVQPGAHACSDSLDTKNHHRGRVAWGLTVQLQSMPSMCIENPGISTSSETKIKLKTTTKNSKLLVCFRKQVTSL